MATPLICKCRNRLFKVSIDMATKTIHLTCAKCGYYKKLEPPSAMEILKRNEEAIKQHVKREVEKILHQQASQ